MKWFRFYHDALDDPKVQRLPGDLFKCWVNMLCLASRNEERGLVTKGLEEIAFALRLSDEDTAIMLADLVCRGLIEEVVEGLQIHNWDARQFKSDNVSERVEKYRENQKSTHVTLHETLHETVGVTLKPSVNTELQINRGTEVQKGEGADAPPLPAKPQKRAARIPANFAITDTERKWAMERGMTAVDVERRTETFVNYWTGESGAKASKLDWFAAWKVWISRDFPDAVPRNGALTVHAGGRSGPGTYGGKRGRDGLTDDERGWRENPGPKGWSADELARMSMDTERSGT